MSNKDIAVGAIGTITDGITLAGSLLPKGSIISNKPAHLIILEEFNGKNKVIKKFITLDKPELLNGFIQAKGIFCDFDEVEILKNFSSILLSSQKELFSEMLFPWHKICSIRNLIFKQK